MGRAWVLLLASCGRIGFDPTGDATAPPVPASCENAVQDADEMGIDCGGACPFACPGESCASDATCVTHACDNNICELASGPPSWLAGPPLPAPRSDLQGATLPDSSFWVVGGYDGAVAVPDVFVLAAGGAAFTTGPPLVSARYAHGVVVSTQGTLYALGGIDASGMSSTTLQATSGGAWITLTGTPTTHSSASGDGGNDGNLYFVDIAETVIYQPGLDSWASVAGPAVERDGVGGVRGLDGKIYAIGGSSVSSNVANVDAFDTTTLTWTARASLATARDKPGALRGPDGRLYAIGGTLAGTTVTASVEAYTPALDRWTAVAPLVHARSAFAYAVAPDGRLYVTGGYDGAVAMTSTEIYGPVLSAPATITAGTTVAVDGTNFAANAPIVLLVDGAQVASGVTDATGATSFAITAPAAGSHVLRAVDARSQYPVLRVVQSM